MTWNIQEIDHRNATMPEESEKYISDISSVKWSYLGCLILDQKHLGTPHIDLVILKNMWSSLLANAENFLDHVSVYFSRTISLKLSLD